LKRNIIKEVIIIHNDENSVSKTAEKAREKS
jgi:hypothetical protein